MLLHGAWRMVRHSMVHTGLLGTEVVACIFFGLGKLNTSEVSWIQTYGFWAVDIGVGLPGFLCLEITIVSQEVSES